MHTNMTGISSFQNGLNHPFSTTDVDFMSKIVEGSHEIQKCYVFLDFGPLFSEVLKSFYRLVIIQSTKFLCGNTYVLNSWNW